MKDVSIGFRTSEADKERLIAAAAKRDIPVSQLIREIIREYFQEENNEPRS